MDKNTNKSSESITFSPLPAGDTCDNCGSMIEVQKFEGSFLCKNCRNQWASMK